MEQTSPLISIIVPVYKVEKYLPACIDSILAQTFMNFELILVDDGSLDNSGKICDEYAQKDNRIKVIHQENGGVTKARATGVNHASGEFVTFVDSDDTIPNDAIESLCKCISPNIDIIIGKMTEDEKFPLNNSIENLTAIINIDIYREMQLSQTYILQSGPVAKLFRRSLFTEKVTEIPRDIVIGEDWLMNIRLSFRTSKNVCFMNHVVYNYIKRSNSITNVFTANINYEKDFFKHYANSIPQDEKEKYKPFMIRQQLKIYFDFTSFTYVLPPKTKELYLSLKKDIKRTKYKLTPIGWCLFYIKNPIIRFFIISLRKILNLLKIPTYVTKRYTYVPK